MQTKTLRANGLDFAVDVAGEGDTVALCLHGFPESRQSWQGQLKALPSLGWTVAAPDLRGYGDSSRPKGVEPYRVGHLVGDVAGLFEALGARRRILIGHDWGGVIAWQVALRRLPLDGLVIINAPHPTRFQQELKTWEQRRRSWYIAFFQLPVLPELQLTARGGRGLVWTLRRQSRHFPRELLETFRRNITQPGAATAMINYYRANVRGLPGQGRRRGKIQTPTLMMWGEDDVALVPALAEGNEAFVADLTLHRLPGVSHWVQQDAPEAVNILVSDWARAQGLAGDA